MKFPSNKMIEMDTQPTLADTCTGCVDMDSITLDLIQRHVDDIVLLTEAEIEASIRLLFEQHRSGSVQENHRVVSNRNTPRLCWWGSSAECQK